MSAYEYRQRLLSDTLDRLKKIEHLPEELVCLLGRTAALQLACGDGINLDCAHPAPCGLPLDLAHARHLAHKILDEILAAGQTMPPEMTEAAGALKQELESDSLDFKAAVTEVTTQAGPLLDGWAQKFPQAPAALRFLLLAALEPSLRAGASAMAEIKGIDADEIHQSGACPVCGHPPYVLELKGKEGFRWATCSLCHFQYRIRRLACPACDSDDPEQIKYFTAEGEPGFRVETCDRCRVYIKTIDFRNRDRKAFASLNDLESLALDFVATEQGYGRCAPSAWGI